MSVWERVQELNGKTLYTLSRENPFEVIGVLADWIIFVPVGGNGTPRLIGRELIENVEKMNLGKENLLPSRLTKEFPHNQNLSYVAAIVHAVTEG